MSSLKYKTFLLLVMFTVYVWFTAFLNIHTRGVDFYTTYALMVAIHSAPDINRGKAAIAAGILAGFVGIVGWITVASWYVPSLLDKWWFHWAAYLWACVIQVGVTYLISPDTYRKELGQSLFWPGKKKVEQASH